MSGLNPNLVFLFIGMIVFAAIMFYGEHHFPNDGQIFQVIAGILTGMATLFFSVARHMFGMTDDKPKAPETSTTDSPSGPKDK